MTLNGNHTRTEKLLLEAARVFNSTLEYEELIAIVLRLVLKAVDAEIALVFRIDHHRTDMKIRMLKAGEEDVSVFEHELGQGVVGWVARYRESAIINDPENDPRIDPEFAQAGEYEVRSMITVPLIGRGQMIGVVEAINASGGEFTEEDLDILIGLNNQIAVAIDNAHLYREVSREASERRALYEVGKKLASTLKLEELVEEILNSLKQVIDFDAGGIFLLDPDTAEMKSIRAIGYDPSRMGHVHLKIGQGLVGHVMKSGEPEIVPNVKEDSRYCEARSETMSEIVVPMKINGKSLGVVTLESDEINAYDSRTLGLLEAFASQAAVSVERAQLYESILASRELKAQLNVAKEIQQSFIPQKQPNIKGYDITGTNIPSGQVGGDYFDFIDIVEGHLGIAIADVSGKGIPAALIMASFRASLIAEIRNNYAIRTICSKVNSLLCESLEPGNFVTAVYGVLNFKNHILTFVNCGHNEPILMRADGSIEYLSEGGPLLGVTTEGLYEERPVLIQPGDIAVFYTDGVTEVFDENEEQFGMERLENVMRENRHRSASEIQKAILDAVTPFSATEQLPDDLTMVVLKRV